VKNLHRCPKCSGKKIWVVERYRVPGEQLKGHELNVLPHAGKASAFTLSANPIGSFDLYLCDGCGYSELWASGFRGKLSEEMVGVSLLDTSDTNEGPFR
jgi:predicted nucleic-acid-binding Zn-ribbon protein